MRCWRCLPRRETFRPPRARGASPWAPAAGGGAGGEAGVEAGGVASGAMVVRRLPLHPRPPPAAAAVPLPLPLVLAHDRVPRRGRSPWERRRRH